MALHWSRRAAQLFNFALRSSRLRLEASMAGDPGSGAGKGGGAGGSIREAGGSFAKMEQAREEQYFRKLQQTQIKLMHDHVMKEIKDREKLIHDLEQQIERNKRILNDLKHINSH